MLMLINALIVYFSFSMYMLIKRAKALNKTHCNKRSIPLPFADMKKVNYTGYFV